MKQLFIILLLCCSQFLEAQYLQNASFEGVSKVGLPEGWLPYGEASSPDTQPGVWNVFAKANHGNSYITMVCRGYSILDSYLWESCYQKLTSPLMENKTYYYSIDLAHSSDFLASTISFNQPINLRIFGINEANQKEQLWQSGSVENKDWKTFYFEINPTIRIETILLEAYYVELPKYNGNIMVDNFQYYPNGFPEKEEETQQIIEEPTIKNRYEMAITIDGKVDSVNGREVKRKNTLQFKNDKITFTVFDNQSFDGDIISLFLNDKCILDKYLLTKEKYSFTLKLDKEKLSQLTLYAHNVGKIPPNTVSLLVNDGLINKKVTLSSNLESCSAFEIEIER